MEELRIAFLVIGSVFIIGVLVHGIWKMRRQNDVPERQDVQRIEPTNDYEKDDQGFDELGVGEVRVVSVSVSAADNELESEVPFDSDHIDTQSEPSIEANSIDEVDADELDSDVVDEESVAEDEDAAETEEPPLYASVITQPKPHMNESKPVSTSASVEQDIPEPPEFLLKEDTPVAASNTKRAEKTEPDFGLSATPAAPTKKATKKRSAVKKRKEPTLGEDQMRIDFDEPKIEPSTQQVDSQQQASSQEQEVLVINVRANEDNALSGAALLPMLLTLGFKFGDHDIFHRHVNANGKGPVLFSLANMVKPGVFDIDNLETFTTQGISLFMVLPCDGDPHQVFNMMHNAARKIADEFGAQLLDGRRSILTKQGIQQYMEKIREFERQRIISKSSL